MFKDFQIDDYFGDSTNPFAVNDEDDKYSPIFRRYNSGFSVVRGSITHFEVCNSNFIIVIDNTKLQILHELTIIKNEIDFSTKNIKIKRLFLHPIGNCMLILSDSNQLVYINLMKFHVTYNFLPHPINATTICWNFSNTALSKTILIGTYEGDVFETDFDIDHDQPVTERTLYKVFSISQKGISHCKNNKICTIATYYLQKYNSVLLILATPQNHFRYFGKASSSSPQSLPIFNDKNGGSVIEIKSQKAVGELCFFPPFSEFPNYFSWLTDQGVLTGKFQLIDGQIEVKDRKLLKHTNTTSELPLSVKLTQFHCVLLYTNRFVAINLINEELVCDDELSYTNGIPKAFTLDPITCSLWYFTTTHVFGFNIWEEDRNIWKILMNQHDFDSALNMTQNNPQKQDIVKQNLAFYYFEQHEYLKSAELLASTNASFEASIIRFVELDEKYLIHYLAHKLPQYENNNLPKFIIIMWVFDLYLMKLSSENNDQLSQNFMSFIKIPFVTNLIHSYRDIFYKIIEQYGNSLILHYLANVLNDHKKIILYHLNNKQYFDAFQCLKQQQNPELWYDLAHRFFPYLPKQITQYWIEMNSIFDPKRLLKSVIHLNVSTNEDILTSIVEYLEFSVNSLYVTDLFIHNYLISLYCIAKKYQQIIDYLENKSKPCYYDRHYILQLCFQHKIFKACTLILCQMDLYEEAIDLALTFDIPHAKELANSCTDTVIKRKLWLIIASCTLPKDTDIQTVEIFLKEAVVLKFEDLLPFFSEIKMIDAFKDAICHSLSTYSHIIDQQKKEIEKLSSISDHLRKKNYEIKKKFTHIEKNYKCRQCSLCVLTKPFYTYPCSHSLHQICMIKIFYHSADYEQKTKLCNLIMTFVNECGENVDRRNFTTFKLNTENNNFNSLLQLYEAFSSSEESLQGSKIYLKQEIDTMMTDECIFCGNFAIENIDKSLILSSSFLDK